MTIVLARWLRYSFSDWKVPSSNPPSLVALTVQREPQQPWRYLSTAKATKRSRMRTQPTSRHARMTQPAKPSHSKRRNYSHAHSKYGIVRSLIRRATMVVVLVFIRFIVDRARFYLHGSQNLVII
ncbi:hypothetical protein TNCV_1308381 [Trichonephila clavipes]|nr:hypothetical protein TNCV_1308381 [Trichonephila clavipes]